MRITGWLMLEDTPGSNPGSGHGRVKLTPGVLRIEDGHIAEVVEGEIEAGCEMGGPGFVVMPGLIDAHVHLPQFGIVGAFGLGLLDWLERVTFPAEAAWADVDVARARSESAMRRMLSHGTTGFAAYATVHAEGARAALESAVSLGVRAAIGQVLMDRGAPPALCRPAERLIDESAGLLSAYTPGSRVSAAVTPRFAPTCSAELLSGAGRLAGAHGALIQSHLAETRGECDLVRELFGPGSVAGVFEGAGLLTGRTVLGHGIYIDDDDRRLLAARGTAIAHCPTANRFLMSGRFDRARALSAGLGVALGSDIGAGYTVSMVGVARAMVETAGAVVMDGGGEVPAGWSAGLVGEAWHAVTAGNALALGWSDAGRLSAGCPADVVLVEPGVALGEGAGVDVLSAMLFGWESRWVRATLLRGRVAWAGGS